MKKRKTKEKHWKTTGKKLEKREKREKKKNGRKKKRKKN